MQCHLVIISIFAIKNVGRYLHSFSRLFLMTGKVREGFLAISTVYHTHGQNNLCFFVFVFRFSFFFFWSYYHIQLNFVVLAWWNWTVHGYTWTQLTSLLSHTINEAFIWLRKWDRDAIRWHVLLLCVIRNVLFPCFISVMPSSL